ncbi:MAG: VOC family protein, partial [Bacteroidaceae bacterium]
MKIDHIAMYVYNLENMKQFFIDYFDAKPNDLYHNSKTGLQTYILSFSNGAKLELMNHPDMVNISQSIYKNGYIHISFSLGSKNAVDELTDRL